MKRASTNFVNPHMDSFFLAIYYNFFLNNKGAKNNHWTMKIFVHKF